MLYDHEDIRVGDVITVKATGTKRRTIVAVCDKFVMVERNWTYEDGKACGPAKIWIKSITSNKAAVKRHDIRMDFYDYADEFDALLDRMAAA